MVLLAAVIGFGLFLAPNGTHGLLRRLAGWRWLSRWRSRMEASADDLLDSSGQMRALPEKQWVGAFVATVISWSARFLTLVAVMGMVVAPLASLEALLIVTRQLVMWVFLLGFTPGPAVWPNGCSVCSSALGSTGPLPHWPRP